MKCPRDYTWPRTNIFNTTSLQRQYVTSCLPSVLIFLEAETRKKRFNYVDSQGSFRNNKLFLGRSSLR